MASVYVPPQEDSEEVDKCLFIHTWGGFVDKKELRAKAFQDSKYHFLQAIKAFRKFDPHFDFLYQPYHLKNLLPIHLVKILLQHNEVEFKFV